MKKLYSKRMRLSELVEKWRKRKKGHFTVYTKEGKRFALPLDYLNHPILQVLLEMAEDEFGTTIDGPLKIPCDGSLMDQVIMLVRRSMSDKYDDDDDGEKKSELCSTTTCKGASVSSLVPLFRGQSQLRSLVS
ncbi:hypothetical protein Bca4012_058032 [Brassica carinata]|uniref:Uncharacterized protein n=1 Tax=Brassica carinata TaxID=52824 RepID=A0A8X7TU54_BRACI|nr:hypothetical protein Bca52824_084583 [Brassica carinata]